MFKFALLVLLPTVLLAQQNNYNRAVESLFNVIDVSDDRRIVLVEVEGYFLSFDRNSDEELSRLEFNQALHHASSGFFGHEQQVFSLFNKGIGNDTLISRTDIDGAFRRADHNNDTRITDQEFHAFFSANAIVG